MPGQDTTVNGQEQLERRDFARIPTIIDLPNLIEVQQKSYARFLQQERPPLDREDRGLEGVFRSVFPIADFNGMVRLRSRKQSITELLSQNVTACFAPKSLVQSKIGSAIVGNTSG